MPRTGRLRFTRPRLVLLGAVAIIVASVARFSRPNYALEPLYTDHLQHEYSAWAFLNIGLRIFDTPKSDWGNVHAAHVHLLWEQLPSLYPPGLIAFFLPAGIASTEGWLPDERVHMLMVMVLGAGAALASYQLVRTLRSPTSPCSPRSSAFSAPSSSSPLVSKGSSTRWPQASRCSASTGSTVASPAAPYSYSCSVCRSSTGSGTSGRSW